MKKHTTRTIRKAKNTKKLSMLTAYDFQTAQALNESDIDLILVGDSLGNVILGYEHTIQVKLEDMIYFGKIVRRGAPDKFIVLDLPFGTYNNVEKGIENACKLFQETQADALKLEGANEVELSIIKRLSQVGVPIMGHIGLKPQRVKADGGYFTKGKTQEAHKQLEEEILNLEKAGAFSCVIECVKEEVSTNLTEKSGLTTIGIGSGFHTDGQVLVINDLLGDSKLSPPSFCKPINNFYEQKKNCIQSFVASTQSVGN